MPSFEPQQPDEVVNDFGASFGKFPVGAIPTGNDSSVVSVSDSDAFTGLRGIQRQKFPLAPQPSTDSTGNGGQPIRDMFSTSDIAAITSLQPGGYNNRVPATGSVGRDILQEFDAGTSTFNSLPSGAAPYSNDSYGGGNLDQRRNEPAYTAFTPTSLVDAHSKASKGLNPGDVPLTPFHRQYVNFGNGQVDYGFSDPGLAEQEASLLRAYHAVLPMAELAGTKPDLMPVFSSIAHDAVEQRPILQSLGRMKGQRFLGGATVLPDELTISPIAAITAGSNIPSDIVQTDGELASYLNILGYRGPDNSSGNAFGATLAPSSMVAGGPANVPNPQFYAYDTVGSNDPSMFSDQALFSSIFGDRKLQSQ